MIFSVDEEWWLAHAECQYGLTGILTVRVIDWLVLCDMIFNKAENCLKLIFICSIIKPLLNSETFIKLWKTLLISGTRSISIVCLVVS